MLRVPRKTQLRTQGSELRKTAIVVLVSAFCVLSSELVVQAATINAATCSQADVQAAIGSVTDGDTVTIPAGTCTWTSSLQVTLTHSITVIGAGSQSITGGNDQTVIRDNLSGSGPPVWSFNVAPGKTLRFSGFTIQAGARTVTDNGSLQFHCNDTIGELRVDHIHMLNLGTGMETSDCFGVVDHSLFDEPSPGVGNSTHINNGAYNGDATGRGHGSWAANTDFGTAKFMYFEDNTFNGGAANDCTLGGRNVFRHNLLHETALQTHPTGGGGADTRGCRAWEAYSNTFNTANSFNGGSAEYNAYFASAGTGVIWGNSAPTGYQVFMTLHSMRRQGGPSCGGSGAYCESPTPAGWGYCGSSFNGTGSAWDQNLVTSTGYACIDQPGRGKGDLISGLMPNAVNSRTGTISWLHQALEPVYEWGNTWTGIPGYNYSRVQATEADVLVANQDYYVGTNPFTGTSGVGSGLLSVRPSTCTPAVAYWATDTNTLYQCSATNAWTTYYTPYTYPHPLQNAGGGYSVCDLNQDNSTNVIDVQLEVNAALGVTACTPAYDINKDGACNVVDVQRVVNAALGGQCVTSP